MQAQTKQCQNCKTDFIIEPDDFGFYEKMKVPVPTFCPECRRQRRNAWRNTFTLYSRKCDSCQKSVISLYAPTAPKDGQASGITIYCNKCWWSDKWDAKSFGAEYDFSKPFFTQFRELIGKVPHISIVNDDGIASLNCEYTHDTWFSKNCYMVFSSWRIENVSYSFFILAGKDMMDCMNIRSKNEFLYECVRCATSYKLTHSQQSKDCIESSFLADCLNCSNCFMCCGLRGKKYHFKNKQYSKEEYEKILKDHRLDTFSGVENTIKEFDSFISTQIQRYAHNFHNDLNVIGEEISNSKNIKNCFGIKKSENCRYCDFGSNDKECYDLVMTGESSECYEVATADQSQLNLFAVFSVKSQDVRYTQHCHNCRHCFGCVGLRDASYCIFNKQYTKEEYETLVPKIIEQMNKMPFVDRIGNSYAYGEFYPIELSPFGYNETLAMEDVAFSKEEAQKRGFGWQDNIQRTTGKETLKPENIPESIDEIGDSILDEVLACIDCKRNYKIVPNELIFYRKMKIPIPRRCFYCRHANRLKKRNPFKLWHRQCMCEKKHAHHEEQCDIEFETTYAPERPEIIYCEKCYQQEVY